jgi:hypothetical protein
VENFKTLSRSSPIIALPFHTTFSQTQTVATVPLKPSWPSVDSIIDRLLPITLVENLLSEEKKQQNRRISYILIRKRHGKIYLKNPKRYFKNLNFWHLL